MNTTDNAAIGVEGSAAAQIDALAAKRDEEMAAAQVDDDQPVDADLTRRHIAFARRVARIKDGLVYDTAGVILGRIVAAGSILHFHGMPVQAETDCIISFAGMESEPKFAGLIIGIPANFQFNAPLLKGNYNPLTGAVQPNDCEVCGAPVPLAAADQSVCSSVCADKLKEQSPADSTISSESTTQSTESGAETATDIEGAGETASGEATATEEAGGVGLGVQERPARQLDLRSLEETEHPQAANAPDQVAPPQPEEWTDPRAEHERPERDPELN